MQGVGDYERAEEALAGMGYTDGLQGVFRRWRQWRDDKRSVALRWRVEGTHRERAVHPGGVFTIENGGQLVHEWPGWGSRAVGTPAEAEKLRRHALRMVRDGGPFGAPSAGLIGAPLTVRDARGIVRKPVGDGSEVRNFPLDGAALALRIWPSGAFTQRPLDYSLDKMYEGLTAEEPTLESLEGFLSGPRRVHWTFRDVHPVLGAVITNTKLEVLLCPVRADLIVVIAARDQPLGMIMGTWEQIRAFDLDSWIQRFGLDQKPPTSTDPPSTPPDASTKRRRPRAATAPGAMPAPKGRVRLKPELAEAVVQHLARVAGALPPGVLGAAVAVELLRALQAAALAGLPTLTGRPIDLLSTLHKKGFLSTVPADQAARAALKLLAAQTPMVRRLHYRRWCLAFGDLQDPASPLRAELGVPTRGMAGPAGS